MSQKAVEAVTGVAGGRSGIGVKKWWWMTNWPLEWSQFSNHWLKAKRDPEMSKSPTAPPLTISSTSDSVKSLAKPLAEGSTERNEP